MDKETINQYKDFYYDKMIEHEWRYCTAFYLTKKERNQFGYNVDRPLTEQESRDFIHGVFSDIKHRLPVRSENCIKRGIPFYAYYLICKADLDKAYHAHVIMNIPEQYEGSVSSIIEIITGKNLLKLETPLESKKHIKYMLRKGNFMVDSDNQYLLPTPYNLGVNRKHFH
jgi:hypothetical protein